MENSKCEICGRKAYYKCRICGRNVCPKHYDINLQICTICKESLCSFCNRKLSISQCVICGRPGCDECLVQIDPSRWVCHNCLREISRKTSSIVLCKPSSKLARAVWG